MSTAKYPTQLQLPSRPFEHRNLEAIEVTGGGATYLGPQTNLQPWTTVQGVEGEGALYQNTGANDIGVRVGGDAAAAAAAATAVAAVGLVEIQPLPISLEARGREDDWTGRSNQAVRKKLQNRLNQRASRRRKRLTTTSNSSQVLPEVQAERTSELRSTIFRLLRPSVQDPNDGLTLGTVNQVPLSLSQPRAPNTPSPHMEVGVAGGASQERMTRSYLASIVHASNFARWIIAKKRKEQGFNFEAFIYPISADHLLTLSIFNLVRGLTTNTISLGVDPLQMHTDLMSPFTTMQLSSSPSNQVLCLPPTLQPTLLQRTIPHHPEVDVLPFPRLRDNAILATGNYDQVELCMSVLGLDLKASPGAEGDRMTEMTSTGLLVWGEPWKPGSWEVSEEFARRWHWLLRGCNDLLDSTNHWRRQRGEPPLMFEF